MSKIMEKRLQRVQALVNYDKQFEAFGTTLAGMDEVGRGPLMGNVVAACVIMPKEPIFPWIDDSKKISAIKRELAYQQIMEHAKFIGIGQATPEEIDQINIKNATKLAMHRAAQNIPATLCIVDAEDNLDVPFKTLSIIKGDATSYNVAAASIVAKVTRDRQILEIAKKYPDYGFETNMGYGTKAHVEALCKIGITPYHRKTFVRKWSGENT